MRMVDSVHDLDNVLFEIGNEGDLTSVRWQYHFIRFIKDYEKGKQKQHPVGMTSVFNILDGSWATEDKALWDSSADWISPGASSYKEDPPAADGKKVVIADVDHIWPAAPHAGWVWRCFLRDCSRSSWINIRMANRNGLSPNRRRYAKHGTHARLRQSDEPRNTDAAEHLASSVLPGKSGTEYLVPTQVRRSLFCGIESRHLSLPVV
jgi:hypothetical protein